MIHTPLVRWLAAAGTAIALAACGGGGDPAPGSAAAPAATAAGQVATGTITGFGSVIVDGVRYDDSAASVKVEDDSASPRGGSLSDLKLGMQVEVRAGDDGRASAVTVVSEVKGRITALAADGFTVAGQAVKVSTDPAAPTFFDGVSGLSGLAVADFVEVHGKRDANDAIVATRVERKDASGPVAIRVVGTVQKLSADASSFEIGGLVVRRDGATRLLPTGATLANGLRVAVWSDAAIVGGTLVARTIVVRRHNLANDDRARVGGPIRGLDFAAKTFRIDGIEVDASSAGFVKGTANDLANGRVVRVRGTFADGRLKASEVRFVRDQDDAKVELTGVVTDFAGQQFKVRGVPVDVSGSGIQYRNGTAANLANGVLVKIEGDVDGNVVKPREVEFVTSDDGRSRWLFGTVSAYVPASGAFRLMGLDARLAETATLRNGDGTAAVRADFGNDDRVQVRGAFAAGTFVVTEVVFRPGLQLVIDDVGGTAYEVDLAAGTFRLNGTVVRVGGTTAFEGSRENLRNGVRVEVEGTLVGGELVASRVEIQRPDADDLARIRGLVSDFVSAADFRVSGQKVDASAAAFEPAGASAASLANGKLVDVRGTVVDGVLKATKVEVK
jgi:hypothetical protein